MICFGGSSVRNWQQGQQIEWRHQGCEQVWRSPGGGSLGPLRQFVSGLTAAATLQRPLWHSQHGAHGCRLTQKEKYNDKF